MTDNRSSRRTFLKATGIAGTAGVASLAGCSGQSNDGSSSSGGSSGGESTESSGSTGTTKGSSSSSMADKIVFYNAGSLKYDPGTKKNIERFEEETGITVDVNEVPWNNLKTSLTTMWRSKSPKVDAFNGPTWWLADFVASDWIEPLDLSDDHMSKFPDNLSNLVSFDGQAYMAPQLGKWGTYLYDQQYLSEAGFDSAPGTWDEVVELGKELDDDKSAFAFTWSNKDVFTFKQFLYQAGGQLFDDSDKPSFVDAGVKVFDFFTRLRENDALPSGISSMGEGGVGDSFIAGQFATAESWTPLGKRALGADDWGKDRLGSAKPPKGPASRATFQDTNGVSVSAYSERKGAAKKFAEFMSTTESCKTDFLVEGNPCVVPSVYDDSDVKEQYPEWLLEDMKYNLEHAQSETYLAQPQVDDYLSEQITPALLGDKDPQKALEDAQANIERLYQDIGIL